MKKILRTLGLMTLTLFLISGISAWGQNVDNVDIPDRAFKAYLVGQDAIDTDFNDEISFAEAEAYSGRINVSFIPTNSVTEPITNLKGIEAFVNITKLFCTHNQLVNLDVSACVKLTYLDCSDNILETLVVPPSLEILLCNHNQLTSLDVSHCTQLSHHYSSFNELTSLSPSISTRLLYCNNNKLQQLDVSGMYRLTILEARDNELTSLNMTNIPYFFQNPSSLTISNNEDLTCVLVDNPAHSKLLYWKHRATNAVDPQTQFRTECLDATSIKIIASATPMAGAAPLTVAFTDETLEAIDGYLWDFGDGNYSNERNPSHTYNEIGSYTVNLYIYQGNGAKKKTFTEQIFVLKKAPEEFVHIPDPIFKTYLLYNFNINTNKDEGITYLEASAYNATINVDKNINTPEAEKIKDLTGIEAFIQLNSLRCNFNAIKHLDLSSCLRLATIICTNNNLETIELPNSVETIHCQNNALKRLDFSGNQKIKLIKAENNQLNYLNLKNSSITSSDNNAILITGNDDLTCVLVDDVARAEMLYKGGVSRQSKVDEHTGFSVDCVIPLEAAFAATPLSGMTPLTVAFNNESTGTPISYLWDFGDGNTSEEENPTHTYVDGGQYTVKLTVTKDDLVDEETKTEYITVEENYVNIPDPIFKAYLIRNTDINTKDDGEISFAEASRFSGVINIVKSTDTPNEEKVKDLTGIEAFTHIKQLLCQYNLITTLDVTKCENLEGLNCAFNNIKTLKVPRNILHIICDNNELSYMDISGFDQIKLLHAYNNQLSGLDIRNSNMTSSNQHELYIHNNPTLTCVLVDDTERARNLWKSGLGDGQVDQQTNFYTVCPTIVAIKAVFSATPLSGKIPLEVSFTNFSTGSPNAYRWDFGDGQYSVEENPRHTYTEEGLFTVRLEISKGTLTDSNTKTNYINVETMTGLETESQDISLYPNPTHSMLTIQGNGNEFIENVTISNLLGTYLTHHVSKSHKITLDISHLISGTYIVNVKTVASIKTYKIIIE